MNMAAVIFRAGVLQIYWVLETLLAYSLVLVALELWRHRSGNNLDTITCFNLVLVAAFGTWFAARTSTNKEDVTNFVITVSCFPTVVSAVIL